MLAMSDSLYCRDDLFHTLLERSKQDTVRQPQRPLNAPATNTSGPSLRMLECPVDSSTGIWILGGYWYSSCFKLIPRSLAPVRYLSSG